MKGYVVLSKYICAATHKATYELLSDGSFYGEIPGIQGACANEGTIRSLL